MKISFYAPLKPIDHVNPSGDRQTGKDLHDFLTSRGHRLLVPSRIRTRNIIPRPLRWPALFSGFFAAKKRIARFSPDLWLTYHAYYKAPDLYGPYISRASNIPYVVFQGIYSTKQRRSYRFWPGFMANRISLLAAEAVFTNKRRDFENLSRLLPGKRLVYIRPGIRTKDFFFDRDAGFGLRKRLKITKGRVVATAAMLRPGVKSRGVEIVIEACAMAAGRIRDLRLIVAGDGPARKRLEKKAKRLLPGSCFFLGRMRRSEMRRVYSSADIFAFPGINEALGLVFLEAQCCGLPVVAFDNAGVPEAVVNGRTGLLVPCNDTRAFAAAIAGILSDSSLKRTLGRNAAAHVRKFHELSVNYMKVDERLRMIAAKKAET